MKKTWRLLDLGVVPPVKVLALRELLATAYRQGLIPSTLCCHTPSLCAFVGRGTSLKSINLDYCHSEGIPVLRCFMNTGAAFFTTGQFRFSLVSDLPFDVEMMFNAVIKSIEFLGLTAYRKTEKSNDIMVNEKKVFGGEELFIRGIHVAGGNVFLDLDYDLIESLTPFPPKLIDGKRIESHREYLTTLNEESGREISVIEAASAFKKGFETVFQIEFETATSMTDAEEQIFEKLREKYTSESWIRHGKWSPVKDYWRPK